MRSYLTTFLIISTLVCCSEKKEKLPLSFHEQISIQPSGSISFELDSVMPTIINYLQVVETDSVEYLVSLNHLDNTLIFYRYQTGLIDFKINFPLQGPDFIGPLESFHIINKDSVLLVSQQLAAGFFNLEGELLNKFNKVDANIRLTPSTTKGNPPVLRNRALYQSGFYLGSTDHNIVLVSSINQDSSYAIYNLPQKYMNGYWGPSEYDKYFHCYNAAKDLFVYSFPASAKVHVTNHNGYETSKYANSKLFDDISSFSSRIKSEEKTMKKTLSQPIYQEIAYDKYNQLYYRIAELPLEDSEIDLLNDIYAPGIRDFVIIVLNEDFEKVGESEIIPREQYDSRIFFVNKDGLHISKLNKDIEDEVQFQIFAPNQLSK